MKEKKTSHTVTMKSGTLVAVCALYLWLTCSVNVEGFKVRKPPKLPKDVDTKTFRACYGKRRANITMPAYDRETTGINVTQKALQIMEWNRLVNVESSMSLSAGPIKDSSSNALPGRFQVILTLLYCHVAVRALELLFQLDEYKFRPKWLAPLTVEDDGLIGMATYYYELLYDDNLSWVANRICRTIMPQSGDCVDVILDILQGEKTLYSYLEDVGPQAYFPKSHYSHHRVPGSVLLPERFITSFYYRPRYMRELHQQYYLNESKSTNAHNILRKWYTPQKRIHEDDTMRLRQACKQANIPDPTNTSFHGKAISLHRVHNASTLVQIIENEIKGLESLGWAITLHNYLYVDSEADEIENETLHSVMESLGQHEVVHDVEELYSKVRYNLEREIKEETSDYYLVWDDAYNFTHSVISNLAIMSDKLPDDVIIGNMAFEKNCYDWNEQEFDELRLSLPEEQMFTEHGFCVRHLIDGKLDYNNMYQIYDINNMAFLAPQYVFSGGFLVPKEKLKIALDTCIPEKPIPHWYYSKYHSFFADIYFRCNWMKVVPLPCIERYLVNHPLRTYTDTVGVGHPSSIYLSDVVLRHFAMDCATKSVINMYDVEVEVDGDSIADLD